MLALYAVTSAVRAIVVMAAIALTEVAATVVVVEATIGTEILVTCAAVIVVTVGEVATWATEEKTRGIHLLTSVAHPAAAMVTADRRCTETKGATSPSLALSPTAAVGTGLLPRDSTIAVLLPAVLTMMVPVVVPR